MASSNQERIGRATKQLSSVEADGGAVPAVAGCCGKLSGTVRAKDRTADGKIDELVYESYGLTEGEIAMVERQNH